MAEWSRAARLCTVAHTPAPVRGVHDEGVRARLKSVPGGDVAWAREEGDVTWGREDAIPAFCWPGMTTAPPPLFAGER